LRYIAILPAEVVVLAQVEDLPDHLDMGGVRAHMRPSRPVPQPLQTVGSVSAQPRVVQLPADPEVPAAHRDVAGDLLHMPEHGQPAPYPTICLKITHAGLLTIKRPGVNHLRQF
jgi:hypothetical protein